MLYEKNEVKTQSGLSEDWLQVPGLNKEDCEILNEICSTNYSSFGRGINGIRRYLTKLGTSNGYIYQLKWIEYRPKEKLERYLIESAKN